MANILFKLRKDKGTAQQPIYLVYWFDSKIRIFYPVGLKVSPAYWNKKQNRVRDMIECTTKDIINNRLNELEAVAEKYITELKAKGEPVTKEEFRSFLDNYMNPPKNDTSTLRGYMQDFVENASNKINGKSGVIVGTKTQLGYKRTLKYFTAFENHTKKIYDFKDLGLDFYNKYTAFLQAKDLSVNSIGREIKTLKVVLNEAKKKGKTLNSEYLNGCFVVTTEESDSVYLNDNELELLRNLDLSNNTRLERVRDLFLVGAWTGLRFSDFTRIKEDNIKDGYIDIEQQKTGKRVVIPLKTVVLEIWNKYDNTLPPVLSNQKFNEYIKEVCKLAGIDAYEHKAITKGGRRRSQRFYKWELVSSHTARRSFATNLFLSEFSTLSIMQITGHKTETSFMRYIKVTPEQHAKLLQLHWIKKGEHLKVVK